MGGENWATWDQGDELKNFFTACDGLVWGLTASSTDIAGVTDWEIASTFPINQDVCVNNAWKLWLSTMGIPEMSCTVSAS